MTAVTIEKLEDVFGIRDCSKLGHLTLYPQVIEITPWSEVPLSIPCRRPSYRTLCISPCLQTVSRPIFAPGQVTTEQFASPIKSPPHFWSHWRKCGKRLNLTSASPTSAAYGKNIKNAHNSQRTTCKLVGAILFAKYYSSPFPILFQIQNRVNKLHHGPARKSCEHCT